MYKDRKKSHRWTDFLHFSVWSHGQMSIVQLMHNDTNFIFIADTLGYIAPDTCTFRMHWWALHSAHFAFQFFCFLRVELISLSLYSGSPPLTFYLNCTFHHVIVICCTLPIVFVHQWVQHSEKCVCTDELLHTTIYSPTQCWSMLAPSARTLKSQGGGARENVQPTFNFISCAGQSAKQNTKFNRQCEQKNRKYSDG